MDKDSQEYSWINNYLFFNTEHFSSEAMLNCGFMQKF